MLLLLREAVRLVAARGDDLDLVGDPAHAGKSGDRLERRVAVGLVLDLPAEREPAVVDADAADDARRLLAGMPRAQ